MNYELRNMNDELRNMNYELRITNFPTDIQMFNNKHNTFQLPLNQRVEKIPQRTIERKNKV